MDGRWPALILVHYSSIIKEQSVGGKETKKNIRSRPAASLALYRESYRVVSSWAIITHQGCRIWTVQLLPTDSCCWNAAEKSFQSKIGDCWPPVRVIYIAQFKTNILRLIKDFIFHIKGKRKKKTQRLQINFMSFHLILARKLHTQKMTGKFKNRQTRERTSERDYKEHETKHWKKCRNIFKYYWPCKYINEQS